MEHFLYKGKITIAFCCFIDTITIGNVSTMIMKVFVAGKNVVDKEKKQGIYVVYKIFKFQFHCLICTLKVLYV